MAQKTSPTLLSSCARASTAEESRYRVNYPNSGPRSTRIFALDASAADTISKITEDPWQGARFLTVTGDDVDPESADVNDLILLAPDGTKANLSAELNEADVVVLISAEGQNAGAAEMIAREAFQRNIMTAGLALAFDQTSSRSDTVVNILRPFASVLVVAKDHEFIPAMLTALRA